MRALIAFDKFKDALSASQACALAAKILQAHSSWEIDVCPLTDGGEGFEETLRTGVGDTQHHAVTVEGPRGKDVSAGFSLVNSDQLSPHVIRLLDLEESTPTSASIALIEMATASGLALLPHDLRNPWQTSTIGTGQLIKAAVEAHAGTILLGVGGSATHDLGLGALSALGLEFLDATGNKISKPIPQNWTSIHRFSGELPGTFPPLRIACDVTNPLLGPYGAAATYAPQKGVARAQQPALETATARMAQLLCDHFGQPRDLVDIPGAGAAGGIAFGLMCALQARLCPGFELVASWLDLETRIKAADVVITGEGRFDQTSLAGKGPGSIARQALANGKAVHVFAGSITLDPPNQLPGLHLHALNTPGIPLTQAIRETPERLTAVLKSAFAP